MRHLSHANIIVNKLGILEQFEKYIQEIIFQ